ncbi:hypothetical protein [Sphingomonas sp.]|uniref:hypothetical protein n=1 Tax=Sphingomonas sp. TaxID=28214 RepID=UPI002EDAF973
MNIIGESVEAAVANLTEIGRYLEETGMPETKFGRLAVHDPRLVGDLRRGRQLGEQVAARIDRFLAERRA